MPQGSSLGVTKAAQRLVEGATLEFPGSVLKKQISITHLVPVTSYFFTHQPAAKKRKNKSR